MHNELSVCNIWTSVVPFEIHANILNDAIRCMTARCITTRASKARRSYSCGHPFISFKIKVTAVELSAVLGRVQHILLDEANSTLSGN